MENYLKQIDKGLESGLYQLALNVTLGLPDICGALGSENGQASKQKYIEWFNEHVAPKYGKLLSAEDCYYFRCSLLHQGTSIHPKSNYSRILFLEPSPMQHMHKGIINGALILDIPTFCRDIIQSVVDWYVSVKETEQFQRNYKNFMRRYPEGIRPYIANIPVIG